MTICTRIEPNMFVPFVIHECSGYYDKNRPTWHQMEKLAIHVTPTKPVGFKTSPGFAPATVTVGGDDDDDEYDDD